MPHSDSNKVLELFGSSTRQDCEWPTLIAAQRCPFTNTKCFKVRKSDPSISIGTCTLLYGKAQRPVVICPNRMLQRRQVFTDCFHLLTQHTPGNELHVLPEISIPGVSVDYFLASVRKGRVKDFVAIEFQTLDTTGTVWPERQRLLRELGLKSRNKDVLSRKAFGMNWKMTAKTTLVQLHHKVETLEHLGKRFVLVIQDCLLQYLQSQFNFTHLTDVHVGDTMHIHAYRLEQEGGEFKIQLDKRLSTDAKGVADCLGILAETKVELDTIVAELEQKISANTLLTPEGAIPIAEQLPTE